MIDDKRKDYLDWDSYFMAIAFISALRSKDPHTRNGACVVNPDTKRIISVGYNGFPRCCSDNEFPWAREAEHSYDSKYDYVIHAERNSINNAKQDISGSTMYLYSERGYYPCSSCAQDIVQSGIKEVIMAFCIGENTDKYNWTATKRMFKAANINIRNFAEVPGSNVIFTYALNLICDETNKLSLNIENLNPLK